MRSGGWHSRQGTWLCLQIGDGSTTLSSSSLPVKLVEYTTAGSLIQTINFPSSGSAQVTLSGTGTSEGALQRSTDKRLLTFGGYAVASGQSSVSGTSGSSVNRAVGIVDYAGTTSRAGTGSSTAFSASSIRGAVSDGTSFWMSGTASTTANREVVVLREWRDAFQIVGNNLRVANSLNGKLYFSTGSSTLLALGSGPSAGCPLQVRRPPLTSV